MAEQTQIMIVDDTPVNLKLLFSMLTEAGYKVRSATNGPLALKAARLAPPDLILLDIRMPDMDGYELCQALKADEDLQHIPVIFISALGEDLDSGRARAVGGVDFIGKPFKLDDVLSKVKLYTESVS